MRAPAEYGRRAFRRARREVSAITRSSMTRNVGKLGSAGSTTFAWLTQYYTFLYILLCFVILLDVLVIAILWLPAMVLSA